MEEEIQDVAADTSAEVQEDTNINETVEETVDLAGELEKERKAKSQILARAKKAEEELKLFKARPQNNNNDPQLSDELKLIARGLSDEAIEQAKVIAKGKGISMPEATKDPLFITWQKDAEEKQRKEDAKLGASKGSGESQQEITGIESGATREDHIKAFNKIVGKK
jgi:hypothetical protein